MCYHNEFMYSWLVWNNEPKLSVSGSCWPKQTSHLSPASHFIILILYPKIVLTNKFKTLKQWQHDDGHRGLRRAQFKESSFKSCLNAVHWRSELPHIQKDSMWFVDTLSPTDYGIASGWLTTMLTTIITTMYQFPVEHNIISHRGMSW